MNNTLNCLVCPETGKSLSFDGDGKIAVWSGGATVYPLADGIIDFCQKESGNDHITRSYDTVSASYDKLLSSATWPARLYNRIVWGLYDTDYVPRVLSLVPDTAGKCVLDVPVGTGVFTVGFYKKAAGTSQIIALDYSTGMLKKAKERFEQNGIRNVCYVRGDVGGLPLAPAFIDILLSMNGYHAFPEKEKALSEMARVVRPGGVLVGCFYVKKQRVITDFVANKIYSPTGSFTPPFYTLEEIRQRLSRLLKNLLRFFNSFYCPANRASCLAGC